MDDEIKIRSPNTIWNYSIFKWMSIYVKCRKFL